MVTVHMTHTLWFHMINIFIIIPVPALILSAGAPAGRNGDGQNAGRHTQTKEKNVDMLPRTMTVKTQNIW